MYIVIFGLTISSSWGNGHATLWRSLVKALVRRGHRVRFFEKDVPYYAAERDLYELPTGATLTLYKDFLHVRPLVSKCLAEADLAICTSYCPDGKAACRLVLESAATLKFFYDLDTPVTLDALDSESQVTYLPDNGLGDFDLVLSYTGGRALDELKSRLGARAVQPWYGSVDPGNHRPVPPTEAYRSDLSYLGTYAADRQQSLETLFIKPAEQLSNVQFLIGGAQYPPDFPWRPNIAFAQHVPPNQHPAFFSSSRATLNVTRGVMARYGFCPSGRLFEAAACGVPLLTDWWQGLDTFFQPCTEVLRVQSATDVVDSLSLSDGELKRIAQAARQRTLAEHTGDRRVLQLEQICDAVRSSATEPVHSA